MEENRFRSFFSRIPSSLHHSYKQIGLPMKKLINQVSQRPWVSALQIIVTVGVFVIGVYIRQVDTSIGNVRTDLASFKSEASTASQRNFDMMFKHFTNDELHAPRSLVVMKPEFAIYQELRNEQVKELRDGQIRIQNLLEKHLTDSK